MKLTDTQLVLLSAASQRRDGAVDIGPKLKGGAADKVIGKLLSQRMVEEIPAQGTLPVWRRDDAIGTLALRITKRGLAAIGADPLSESATDASDHVAKREPGRSLRRAAAARKPADAARRKPAKRPPTLCAMGNERAKSSPAFERSQEELRRRKCSLT